MSRPLPTYGPEPKELLRTVDLALALLHLVREQGSVGITDAARDLGESPSRIHRSLQMLVYRGFCTRTQSREYLPGPALYTSGLPQGRGRVLVEVCQPFVEAICRETSETVHVISYVGAEAHFLYSAEGFHHVRCSDRRGTAMPLRFNAAGRAYLAQLSSGELRGLYPHMNDGEFDELRKVLHRYRTEGFGINQSLFEHEVSAVGTCLFNELGDPLGGISVAIPSSRFRESYPQCVRSLVRHTREMNRALAATRDIDR